MGELYQGRLLVETGQTEGGLQRMLDALEAIRVTGTLHGWSQQAACLIAACLKAGRVQQGLDALDKALPMVDETGERYFEAELSRLKGELLRMDGDEGGAEASLRQAIEVAQSQSARSWELRATTSLAHLWQKQGRSREVRQMLAQVYDWFTEGFDTRDLEEARMLLEELT